MSAQVNPVRPLNPPYYHRDYGRDLHPEQQENANIYQRTAVAALPFLSLYEPLKLPIAVGTGALRAYNCTSQVISDLKSGVCENLEVLQSAVSVVAVVSNAFGYPVGAIITTSQDVLFELNDLIQSLQEGKMEDALVSVTKITNNTLYLALVCNGGLELSIASLAMQGVVQMVSAREEFKKGRILEGCGNLLMAGVRLQQGYFQYKLLERRWEIEEAIRRVFVGELHEQWQFPSDHLPVGVEVDGVKIISWNVLNNAYMEWVTTRDSQGLNGSLISDLDHAVRPDGLTQRDLLVVDMVEQMIHSGDIVALQECGVPFLDALQERLPSDWQMVKSFNNPREDQDVILFNVRQFALDQSQTVTNAYPSVPGRPVQSALFSRLGQPDLPDFQIVNAHIPGDPNLPVRDEFAKYVYDLHRNNQITVALGDNNFERDEMIRAYENMGFADFSVHSPWKTNIDPYGKYSKAIDHFFVTGNQMSRDLTPNEVVRDYNLLETIDLLNGKGEI